jgi:hypothetical protein
MAYKKLILILFALMIGFAPEIYSSDGFSKEYKRYSKSKSAKLKMKKRQTYQFRFRTMKPNSNKKKKIQFPFASINTINSKSYTVIV